MFYKSLMLVSLLAALALVAAGCGSSKKTAASSASGQGGPPQAGSQAFAQFQQCLQDHGVTLPNGRPQGGQPGQRPTFDAKTQKAFRACSQYLPARPQGGGFGGGGQGFGAPPSA